MKEQSFVRDIKIPIGIKTEETIFLTHNHLTEFVQL